MAKVKGHYVFTPKRQAALAIAQAKSARLKRAKAKAAKPNSGKKMSAGYKAGGVKHLRKNFVPYTRINQRSVTVGANTGAGIPFSNKRVSMGSYFRIENKNKRKPLNEFITRTADKFVKPGTRAHALRQFASESIKVDSPVVRMKFGPVETQTSTSRASGPTVVIRRGQRKVRLAETKAGVAEYDRRMRVLFGQKKRRKQHKPRPERRGR